MRARQRVYVARGKAYLLHAQKSGRLPAAPRFQNLRFLLEHVFQFVFNGVEDALRAVEELCCEASSELQKMLGVDSHVLRFSKPVPYGRIFARYLKCGWDAIWQSYCSVVSTASCTDVNRGRARTSTGDRPCKTALYTPSMSCFEDADKTRANHCLVRLRNKHQRGKQRSPRNASRPRDSGREALTYPLALEEER